MSCCLQAGNIPAEFLPPEKFKNKAYIKDAETVRMLSLPSGRSRASKQRCSGSASDCLSRT